MIPIDKHYDNAYTIEYFKQMHKNIQLKMSELSILIL